MSTLAKFIRQKKRWQRIEADRTQHRTDANLRADLLLFNDRCSLCERTLQAVEPSAVDFACLLRKSGRLFCRTCTPIAHKLLTMAQESECAPC